MENHTKLWQTVVTLGMPRRLARNSCSRHVVAVALAVVGSLTSLSVAKTAHAEPNYLRRGHKS